MLVLVDFPEDSTDMFMVFLVSLVMLFTAVGWVSTVGAFKHGFFAMRVFRVVVFFADGAGAMGFNPFCLGANRSQGRFAQGMKEVSLFQDGLESGGECGVLGFGLAGGEEGFEGERSAGGGSGGDGNRGGPGEYPESRSQWSKP